MGAGGGTGGGQVMGTGGGQVGGTGEWTGDGDR